MSAFAENLRVMTAGVLGAPDDSARHLAFREGFRGLRNAVDLHPAGRTAAATFEASAASTVAVASQCLPLGLALVMHLYPLGVLRHAPLPWWTRGGFRRSRLLRLIDREALILANAGGERVAGPACSVIAARAGDGLRISGTYDYVSLAHVADLVLFTAPLAQSSGAVFCAARLSGNSMTLGSSPFTGRMLMSDTSPVRFVDHLVPAEYSLEVPASRAASAMTLYQRSWCQWLLAECYLARAMRLESQWNVPESDSRRAALNELLLIRHHALRLLDEARSFDAIESLSRVTAAIKLKVSWLVQETATAIRPVDPESASELGFLRRQPTSDDRILQSLEAPANRRATVPPPTWTYRPSNPSLQT